MPCSCLHSAGTSPYGAIAAGCNPPWGQVVKRMCSSHIQSLLCLQGKKIRPSQKPLPDLPSNAQYVFHDNLCYDWGTFGWALSSAVSDISSYSYFVFLNSSVRGPHLPAYWPVSFLLDWHPTACHYLYTATDFLMSDPPWLVAAVIAQSYRL